MAVSCRDFESLPKNCGLKCEKIKENRTHGRRNVYREKCRYVLRKYGAKQVCVLRKSLAGDF